MAKRLAVNADKINIIPLGIELPELNGNDLSLKKSRRPMILFVGRFERRKGFHTLIEAVPDVIEQCTDASFVFIGRDTFKDENNSSFRGDLKHSFKEQTLKKLPPKYLRNIEILSHMDNQSLQKYLRRCDVFVAPSLFETFGLVYVEAMSYAKPVIGSNAGGIPEVVRDGVSGFLIDPDAPQALAKAIVRLIKDPGLRQKMGANGRRSVEEHFNRALMAENTIKLYESLL
jgi:glycosyltransferase involved in cell wall biosynthesis